MLTLIFNQSRDVSATITGVAASPAIGATRIDVDFVLAGVAASPAIGTGTILLDFIVSITGIAASPAIGATRIDVDFVLAGVPAAAAIGHGTIDIQAAQSHGAGGGRFERRFVLTASHRTRPREKIGMWVKVRGVAAQPRIGKGRCTVAVQGAAPARSASASGIGHGEIISVVDLTEDEILLLLLLAA